MSISILILLLSVYLLFIIIVSVNIRINYHLKAYNRIKNYDSNYISITFDDGPNLDYTPKVLNLLKKYNAKATFFCIGKNINSNPSLIKKIIDDGHTIGNHTYTHSNLIGFFSKKRMVEEIDETNKKIFKITNKNMRLFRPPYGITNPMIAKAIKETGHKAIGWNIRTYDTIIKNPNIIFYIISRKISPGSIILLHDKSNTTIKLLEMILIFLKKNNYKSITIDKLFNLNAYA